MDKEEKFQILVSAIEKKYQHLFDDHENPITGKNPDKIELHYMLSGTDSYTQIHFRKDSYLPKFIQTEIDEAFVTAYSDK